MAGPWEKYSKPAESSQSPAAKGPWDKYAQSAPTQIPEAEEPNMLVQAAEAVDSYTGAPTRAAIGALQDGNNPLSAAYAQFGEDPKLAPTGKQIAVKAGLDDKNELFNISGQKIVDAVKAGSPLVGSFVEPLARATGLSETRINPSTAGAVGLGIDIAADPTNLLGIGEVRSMLGGATKAIASKGLSTAGKVASVVPGATKAARGAEIVVDSAKNTASAISKMFKPTQADDFKALVSVAEKHGIDPSLLPEAVEFGHNSVITRAARNRAEGVLGEPHLNKFHEGLEAVRDATEKKIATIGGGHMPDHIEAGEIIRSGFDKGVDNFFKTTDVTHNRMMEAMPGLQMAPESMAKIESKINGIEKWAKGRAQRGFTNAQRAQAEQVLRAVDAVRNGNGSYKQTVEALRDIGEVAFKSKNIMADVPPDIEKFRDLYFTIDDGLIDTVGKTAGAPVAEELRATNKAISEFLGEKSAISGSIGNKNLSPEKLFTTLVENGDSRKIEALKKILPPEEFQKLKGAFLRAQVRKNADDVFTFKGLHNNLANKKNVLGSLLDANEIEELGELIKLGDRFGAPVLSTSGTGGSFLFSDLPKGIRSGMESDALIGTLKDAARNRTQKALQGADSAAKQLNQSQNKMLPAARQAMSTPAAKKLATFSPMIMRALSVQKNNKDDSSSVAQDGETSIADLKGENKWTVDGLARVIEHNEELGNEDAVAKILSSKKGKNLLIQASSMKPGSKAMENIYLKIKKDFANEKQD